MDNDHRILKQYAQLLKTYVDMRQQLVDLLRVLDEEEVSKETGAQRTASELLDMAFVYMDEARERLEEVDKLLVSVQPLFFGHNLLSDGPHEDEVELDNLRDLLSGLNLDLD